MQAVHKRIIWIHCLKTILLKESESYVTTDGQPASLSWNKSTHLGLTTRSLLLSDSCGFVDLGRPLWRENGPIVHNCSWPSPAHGHILLSQIQDFPFHRLLRLAGSRWRYSTPPLHGSIIKEDEKMKLIARLRSHLQALLLNILSGPFGLFAVCSV
jgi:hypothetical protein